MYRDARANAVAVPSPLRYNLINNNCPFAGRKYSRQYENFVNNLITTVNTVEGTRFIPHRRRSAPNDGRTAGGLGGWRWRGSETAVGGVAGTLHATVSLVHRRVLPPFPATEDDDGDGAHSSLRRRPAASSSTAVVASARSLSSCAVSGSQPLLFADAVRFRRFVRKNTPLLLLRCVRRGRFRSRKRVTVFVHHIRPDWMTSA